MAKSRPFWIYLLMGLAIMSAAASAEWWMGRRLISQSGRVMLWAGNVNSPENSQQLIDWYSFSHIVHGCILYGLIRLLGGRKWPIGWCVVAAITTEASWEVLENSSFIIDRYRQSTISVGYYGDSILNSMSDITFCMIGVALAAMLPAWGTVGLVVFLEVGLALIIRDNLTLNVIMLLHPFQAIKHWQMGAG